MTQKVSVSGSSGYINIPIHVLYKTEYINSVVEERGKKPKHFGTCIKKCKQSINYTVNKFKNYVNSLTRGFYQEFILNNVDAKTKHNLLSYIKSLNLDIKECLAEEDGTKVIKVDIGPIKNKPEIMNDLLVYIENEKLKIARRNEILSKSQGDKNYVSNSEDWNSEKANGASDVDLTSLSINFCEKYDKSDISKQNIEPGGNRAKLTKKKVKIKKKKFKADSGRQEHMKHGAIDFAVNSSSCESNALHFSTKYNTAEDPLKKAKDYKDKITSISAPSMDNNKKKDVTIEEEPRKVEAKHDSTIECTSSSLISKDGLTDIDISLETSDAKAKKPNKISTGVGIFWNAGSMIFNDQKVCMIERADRVKEESINVISILANRGKKPNELSLSALKSETNSTLYRNLIESGNTVNHSKTINENKQKKKIDTKEIQLNNTKLDSNGKSNVQEKKRDILQENKIPIINMKDVEVYMSNGAMSDPSFRISDVRPLKTFNDHGDTFDISKSFDDDEIETKPKKKNKFFRFWRKFTRKKKKSSDKKMHSEKSIENIPVRKEVIYSNNTNVANIRPRYQIVENMKNINLDKTNNKYLLKENNKLKINIEDSKVANPSLLDLKELESFQLSSLNSFIVNGTKGRTSDKKKFKNVVDKLYQKLKGMRRVQEISDSESSSESVCWPQGNNLKYRGEISSSSIYSYPSRTSSIDTINSVTRTAIKKLAKPFPSMNTK